MQVAHHYFKKVLHFTRRINECVSLDGDVAPFVGHKAFLRWTAVHDALLSIRRTINGKMETVVGSECFQTFRFGVEAAFARIYLEMGDFFTWRIKEGAVD